MPWASGPGGGRDHPYRLGVSVSFLGHGLSADTHLGDVALFGVP